MNVARLYVYSLITRWLPETRFFELKARLLRWCGAEVGKNVRINSSVKVIGTGQLVIGDDVWIGANCFFSPVGTAQIRVGNHVDIAPECTIITGSHYVDVDGEHIGGQGVSASVRIDDGCWLGARALVLPGVFLAKKTLVAAGAVVTKSVDISCCLLAGVPAEVKKRFTVNTTVAIGKND